MLLKQKLHKISTRDERINIIVRCQSLKNVVLGYFLYPDSIEQRTFLEAAYQNNGTEEFILTNNIQVVSDLKESSTQNKSRLVWLLHCKTYSLRSGLKIKGVCFTEIFQQNIDVPSILKAIQKMNIADNAIETKSTEHKDSSQSVMSSHADRKYTVDHDEVREVVFGSRYYHSKPFKITSLTEETLPEIENSSTYTLIVFLFKYEPVGIAFVRLLEQWQSQFGENYPTLSCAMVNCLHWNEECNRYNITHSPTIKLLGKPPGKDGQDLIIDYTGVLNAKSAMKFLYLHSVEDVIQATKDDVNNILNGSFQSAINLTSMCILGLFPEQSTEIKEFYKVAKAEKGTALFILLTGSDAAYFGHLQQVAVPSVLTLKWTNQDLSISKMVDQFSAPAMTTFVKNSYKSHFMELFPDILPKLLQSGQPLVILFIKSMEEDSYSNIQQLSMSKLGQEMVFTWINVTALNNFGTELLETYFENPFTPALSVVYFSESMVYNYEGRYITVDPVRKWFDELRNRRHSMQPSYKMQHAEMGLPRRENTKFLKSNQFQFTEFKSKESISPSSMGSIPKEEL
ncbi:thioredoxin domain-containing protein 16 [Octopus bimaculoides]|nr:thioredoxin domain-containing protein 16 [Octopus bimaculoides]